MNKYGKYSICFLKKFDKSNERQHKPLIILLFWEFFTPGWADGSSLEFEWQQVF